MYLFLLYQDVLTEPGCIAACVVVSEHPDYANQMHPDPSKVWMSEQQCWGQYVCDHLVPADDGTWPAPDNVNVQFIGEAAEHLQPGPLLHQIRLD